MADDALMAPRPGPGLRPWLWAGGSLVLLAVAWQSGLRAELRPSVLREAARQEGDALLARAGFGWARLEVVGTGARLTGTAPDPDGLSRLSASAADLLAPVVGVPGVFPALDLQLRLADGAAAAPVAAAAPSAEGRTAGPADAATAAAAAVTPGAAAAPVARTAACEGALRRAASQAVVRYSAGSFALEGPARRAVAQLVSAAQACPDWRWTVRAGGDTAESSPANADIAARRVRAATEVLLASGLPAAQVAEAPTQGGAAPVLRRLEFRALPITGAAR
jgi:hypothetical protein